MQTLFIRFFCAFLAGLFCSPVFASLQDAVDNPNLDFVTGFNSGNPASVWFRQTTVHTDGSDAARSGPIAANQATWMETEVTGPGIVTFQWQVSSNSVSAGGRLQFFTGKPAGALATQWLLRSEISGQVTWNSRSFTIPAGRHLLRWQYQKGSGSSSGEDAGWVDQVVWAPVNAATLAEATDAVGLNWTTSGSAGIGLNQWFGTILESADGQDSARSPIIGPNQETWMQTEVTGPGIVTFQWQVSSNSVSAGGRLQFFTGKPAGALATQWLLRSEISGQVTWNSRSFTIPAGRHLLRWQYQKGSGSSSGEDAGWVDQVVWAPVNAATLAEATDAVGLNWTTSGSAGIGLNQWFGTILESADGQDSARSPIIGPNQETWMQTEVTGPGIVTFQWQVSSNNVSAGGRLQFLAKSTDPSATQWLSHADITGQVAWSTRSFTVPAGRHYLRWRYIRGSSSSTSGEDAGWVDQVSFTPDNVTTAPSIHTPQSSYAFTVMQGASGSLLIPLSNFGTQPLVISNLAFSEPWAVASTTSASIGGLSSGSILFTASASNLAPGIHSGTLEIQSNAPGSLTKTLTVSIMVFAHELGETDSDSDGLPDWYEIAHGLDLTRDDSVEDSDGDGFSNFLEYLYGSLASSATIQPDIGITIGQAVEIIIPTVTGATYQIQSTEALGSGVWSNIGPPIVGDGTAVNRFFSALGKTKDFYRVIVQ